MEVDEMCYQAQQTERKIAKTIEHILVNADEYLTADEIEKIHNMWHTVKEICEYKHMRATTAKM